MSSDRTGRILAQIDGALSVSADAMRAAPVPEGAVSPSDTGPAEPFDGEDSGEPDVVIFVVIDPRTRADMLADGDLVAVPEDLAREARFPDPVALTRAAWDDCVRWSDADTDRQTPQQETARLRDVLITARYGIRQARHDRTRVPFEMSRVPRDGRAREAEQVTLSVGIGLGDNAEPVITIRQPHED
ncbi:DUF6573 family protein [Streptomyces sp. NPDC059718]